MSSLCEPGETAAGSNVFGFSMPIRNVPPVAGPALAAEPEAFDAPGFFESVHAATIAIATTTSATKRRPREQDTIRRGGVRIRWS